MDLSCQVATALVSVKQMGRLTMIIPEAINNDDEATTVLPQSTGVATRANGKWQNSVKPATGHMLIFIKTNSKNAPVLVMVVLTNFLISSRRPGSPDIRHWAT